MARAVSISIHLINTFLLVASLSLTAYWAAGGPRLHLAGHGLLSWLVALGLAIQAILQEGPTITITLTAAGGVEVVNRMKAMPTMDDAFGAGTIRPDGRKLHDAYLFEVKKPAESKGPWDYYKLRATLPANEVFRPMSEGDCPLVKK
jgi:hypothetical protein